jgi:hypothetical protein
MKNEFIPYAQALALKELGFNEPCFGKWLSSLQSNWKDYKLILERGMNEGFEDNRNVYFLGGACSSPTFSQAFRWFREEHNILAIVYSNASGYLYEWSDNVGGTHRGWSNDEGPNNGGVWDTYEEAELSCLKKLIELLNQTTKP